MYMKRRITHSRVTENSNVLADGSDSGLAIHAEGKNEGLQEVHNASGDEREVILFVFGQLTAVWFIPNRGC